MGDVTGPISTLPYASHELPDGAVCDCHPDRKAVANIQGETDSFGCETHYCCEECCAEIRQERIGAREEISRCDWCKQDAKGCTAQRDYDEGTHGPVYHVCPACRKKYSDEIERDLAQYDDGYDDYEDDDHL